VNRSKDKAFLLTLASSFLRHILPSFAVSVQFPPALAGAAVPITLYIIPTVVVVPEQKQNRHARAGRDVSSIRRSYRNHRKPFNSYATASAIRSSTAYLLTPTPY